MISWKWQAEDGNKSGLAATTAAAPTSDGSKVNNTNGRAEEEAGGELEATQVGGCELPLILILMPATKLVQFT